MILSGISSNPLSINDFSFPPTLVPVKDLIRADILVFAGVIFAISGVIASYWILFEITVPGSPIWIEELKYKSLVLVIPIFVPSKSVEFVSILIK